jgi:hypothetical protein
MAIFYKDGAKVEMCQINGHFFEIILPRESISHATFKQY